jgi:hypothetical protein
MAAASASSIGAPKALIIFAHLGVPDGGAEKRRVHLNVVEAVTGEGFAKTSARQSSGRTNVRASVFAKGFAKNVLTNVPLGARAQAEGANLRAIRAEIHRSCRASRWLLLLGGETGGLDGRRPQLGIRLLDLCQLVG